MNKIRLGIIPVIIFLVMFSVSVSAVLVCGFSCDNSDKAQNYRMDLKKGFEINIPQEWECLYHNSGSLGGWHGDGTAYYVFDVTERDVNFFNEFSKIKNEEFENSVIQSKEIVFDRKSPIDADYLFDFAQSYEWYNNKISSGIIEMIFQSQKLFVIATYF